MPNGASLEQALKKVVQSEQRNIKSGVGEEVLERVDIEILKEVEVLRNIEKGFFYEVLLQLSSCTV